jgi:hypothetical protein
MKKYILAIAIFFFNPAAKSQQKFTIVSNPAQIFIEQGENHQYVNSDFLITNNSTDTFTISRLVLSVFDNNNKLVYSRFLDNNGTAPSIHLIPNRYFNGQESHLIFNPFPEFDLTLPLNKLVFEWTFTDNADKEIKITTDLFPGKRPGSTKYLFPLKGRVLVYDGHDLYAHHRRFDFEFPPIKSLGFHSNFMRYAYDFVVLNSANQQNTGNGKDEDYFGFNQPVYAVGNGKVIYASNTHKDDKSFNIPGMINDPLELYGNCIAIVHADQSVSVYGHLKQNSIKVVTGQQVKEQEEIGRIGISGSSFFPHLHFEMRTSILHNAEGLPSYFSNIYLLEGATKRKLKSGLAETGNIIETK